MKVVDLYAFKVRDYTTVLFGQKETEKLEFYRHKPEMVSYYVQRGDGKKQRYHEDTIEWVEFLGTFTFNGV